MVGVRHLTVRLGRLVQNALESVSESENEIILTGDFCIDFGSHQVTVRGQEVELTQEEFDMLAFLVTHPKSVITPHTRLATCWGHNQTRRTDFLRALSDLRKKIESVPGSTRYIRMESWVVYRFDPGKRKEVQ